jgi:bacteriorhodopsin
MSGRAIASFGLVSVAVAAALSAAGVFTEIEYRYTKYALSVVFILVVALIVFGVVVPRAARRPASAGRVGLTLSILAVITVVAFWSGLPPVLAPGGIVLGYIGREHARRGLVPRAAIGVGALALVLDGVAYGTDIASRF